MQKDVEERTHAPRVAGLFLGIYLVASQSQPQRPGAVALAVAEEAVDGLPRPTARIPANVSALPSCGRCQTSNHIAQKGTDSRG